MFETVRLLPHSADGIPLVTRAKKHIKNSVAPAPSQKDVQRWTMVLASHPAWNIRKGPVGRYNCAGHVWASRRTAVYDDDGEIAQIWREDGYRQKGAAELKPGDIVVFFHRNGGSPGRNFMHVAEIVELPENPRIPVVLSKFADWGGEIVHAMLDLPRNLGEPQIDYEWEYWGEP